MLQPLTQPLTQPPPKAVLAGTFLVFLGPFLAVMLFPAQLELVMEKSTYLVFHNVAEFFSIMVSLSVFSVGWYTYDQSKDRRALFLGTAFLAVGLLDFMHTLSNAAMPAFFTPNSTNKSTQFWISARLFDASALLASAYVYADTQGRWLAKTSLLAASLSITCLLFTGIVFFPEFLPATAIQGVGLTPLKRYLEFAVILLLVAASVAYWRRMARTGDRLLIYNLAAFIICIFSEAVFASYKTGFDTYNVLGHIYKVVAFYLIYKGIFASSVQKPYVDLSGANEKLRLEIAERKRAEAEIQTLNRELEQRVAARTAQLEAANRELEAFSYSVSHDLRAPLRAIEGFGKILVEDHAAKLDDGARGYLDRIFSATQRMGQLIEDLLNFSRVSRGDFHLTAVDLSAMAGEIAGNLKKANPQREAEFVISGGLLAEGDERLLRVALENLLGNAWKFTGRTSRCRIEFGALALGARNAEGKRKGAPAVEPGKTIYYVRDNGAGFAMSYADKLFTPFQRLHNAQEFPGTGIGLATVQRIISRHGGKIWAEGEVGKGATMYFTLA